MKLRPLSLRMAILVPFILAATLILVLTMTLWTHDYNQLIYQQGKQILTAMNTNTKQALHLFLTQPQRINELFANSISERMLYGKQNTTDIQVLATSFIKKTNLTLPQISVISYGDENRNYVGIRSNSTPHDYSLMLQDARTRGELVIYQTLDSASKILASYPDYDPRTRPWYAPVKARPVPMWSEVYINQDEKQETTISSLIPVFDKNGKMKGVSDVDIRLNAIHDFLANTDSLGNGLIYIVDSNWKVISNSKTVAKAAKDDLDAELVMSTASDNELIQSSATFLMAHNNPLDTVSRIKIGADNHFVLMSELEEPSGLNWKIIVVLPEIDLMGDVEGRKNTVILLSLLIGCLTSLLGFYFLDRIILPLRKSAEAAEQIASGNWNVCINSSTPYIRETNLLVSGFNTMSQTINDSFMALQEANQEIERLHENEKNNLEIQISMRTEELKIALQELMDREKLASLGSLVTGIAHEINTPLGVAITANSYLEMLIANSQHKNATGKTTLADLTLFYQDLEESVSVITRNLDRASCLVKSFKQIAVEQNMDEEVVFDLHPYLQSALQSLTPALKQGKHTVDLVCDRELRIKSYPAAFSQIMTNLVMNSVHHGFQDNKEGSISIAVHHTIEKVVLTYTDDGRGISPDVLPKIFDPFFTTNRAKGGSGLGLNIVYNIVTNQLKGKINCQSSIGNGAVFKIEVPLSTKILND